MNKPILSFVCIGLCAVAYAEDPAFEGQPIGMIAVSSGTKSTMVAVAFKQLGATVADVTANNLVSTKNLEDGDTLYVYQNGGYKVWQKSGNDWVAPDEVFSLTKAGTATIEKGSDPSTVSLTKGSGFWLIRKTVNDPFYIYGAAVDTIPTVAVAGAKTLMGNPTARDQFPTISTPVSGDQIGLYAGDDKAFLKVYTYNGSAWTHDVAGSAGGLPVPEVVQNITIPSGIGFWYNSTGNANVSFTWED